MSRRSSGCYRSRRRKPELRQCRRANCSASPRVAQPCMSTILPSRKVMTTGFLPRIFPSSSLSCAVPMTLSSPTRAKVRLSIVQRRQRRRSACSGEFFREHVDLELCWIRRAVSGSCRWSSLSSGPRRTRSASDEEGGHPRGHLGTLSAFGSARHGYLGGPCGCSQQWQSPRWPARSQRAPQRLGSRRARSSSVW